MSNFYVGQRVCLKQGFGLWANAAGEPIGGTITRLSAGGATVHFDNGSVSTHHSSALIAVAA